MQLVFADDSRQLRPTRPGMGPLIAIGGICVPHERLRELELTIDRTCGAAGFPPGQEFKWSPGRELWMRDNLVGDARTQFFIDVLTAARGAEVRTIVVIEDSRYRRATPAASPEVDVTRLFLERVNNFLRGRDCQGIIIADRPGGDRADEDRFLAECLETLQSGTGYVTPDRIALNVLSTPSHLVRLVQLADLVTSCTVASIGGEETFSPPVFNIIKNMLHSDDGRIGGVGLKLHPDYRYANLYHWLLGDIWLIRGMGGAELPLQNRPYAHDPGTP